MTTIQDLISRTEAAFIVPQRPLGTGIPLAVVGVRWPGQLVMPDQVDDLQGLPALAVNEGATMPAFDVPEVTATSAPDVVQMADDISKAGGVR